MAKEKGENRLGLEASEFLLRMYLRPWSRFLAAVRVRAAQGLASARADSYNAAYSTCVQKPTKGNKLSCFSRVLHAFR